MCLAGYGRAPSFKNGINYILNLPLMSCNCGRRGTGKSIVSGLTGFPFLLILHCKIGTNYVCFCFPFLYTVTL